MGSSLGRGDQRSPELDDEGEIVAPSPLPGLGIDRDKVPSNTQSVQAPQITTQGPTPARLVGYSEVESCCKDSLIIWTTA